MTMGHATSFAKLREQSRVCGRVRGRVHTCVRARVSTCAKIGGGRKTRGGEETGRAVELKRKKERKRTRTEFTSCFSGGKPSPEHYT